MSKVKIIKSTLKNKGIVELFNSMTGVGAVNLEIVIPKLYEMTKVLTSLETVFKNLSERDFCIATASKDITSWYTNIGKVYMPETLKGSLEFYKSVLEATNVGANTSIADNSIIDKLQEYIKKQTPEFIQVYSDDYNIFKKSDIINTYMTICGNLKPYESNLKPATSDNNNNGNVGKFIEQMQGSEFIPFNIITRFNFIPLFINPETHENVKKYLMKILQKVYELTHRIYSHMITPDIDVNEFAEIIRDSITDVRKKIPRCNRAFNKIEESMDLLKSNFNDYYKDFAVTKNPSSIITQFVKDVSEKTKGDAKLAFEFSRIVAYYNKLSEQNGTAQDPQVKGLFTKLTSTINQLAGGAKDDSLAEDLKTELEDDEED